MSPTHTYREVCVVDFAAAALMSVAEATLAEEVEDGVCVMVRTVSEELVLGAAEVKADEDERLEVEIDVDCNAGLVVETRLIIELVVVGSDSN